MAHNQGAVDEILNPKTVATVNENQVKQAPPTQSNLPKTPAQKKAEWEMDLQTQGNHGHLTQDECTAIAQNMVDIEQALGVAKGDFMTYEQADNGAENPKYATGGKSYHENCQTCTITHLLRRRGFDVSAKSRKDFDNINMDWTKRFLNADGTAIKIYWSSDYYHSIGLYRGNEVLIEQYLSHQCREDGIYEIYCAWKNNGGAHVFCAEVRNGKIQYFDPQ